jgi:hypothetical protein
MKKTKASKAKTVQPGKPEVIIYQGAGEILVCLPTEEKELLEHWFGPYNGRRVENYNRLRVTGVARLGVNLTFSQLRGRVKVDNINN